MPDPSAPKPVPVAAADRSLDEHAELPVVARLVVEIRSDGTRTIARGAMEDVTLGQKVAVEAEGTSPAALASSLLRSLAHLPFSASRVPSVLRTAVKALLPGRRR